jgi:hypothetical protein
MKRATQGPAPWAARKFWLRDNPARKKTQEHVPATVPATITDAALNFVRPQWKAMASGEEGELDFWPARQAERGPGR